MSKEKRRRIAYYKNRVTFWWRCRSEKKIIEKFRVGKYPLQRIDTCLCGGKYFEVVTSKDRYGIPVGVQLCRTCGLGIQNPRPTDKALHQFYKSDYRKLNRGTSKIDHDYFQRGYRRGQGIIAFLEEHDTIFHSKMVVEVGCGPGGILKAFQENDNDVLGCELDTNCVAYSNAKGINTLYGDVSTIVNEGIQADLIILNTDFFASVQVAHLYYFDLVTLKYIMAKSGFCLVAGNEKVNSIFKKCGQDTSIPIKNNFENNSKIMLKATSTRKG